MVQYLSGDMIDKPAVWSTDEWGQEEGLGYVTRD